MIDWDACKIMFAWDGSWRDLYVLDTDIRDWQTVFEFLKVRNFPLSYSIDQQPNELPLHVETIFEQGAGASVFLTIDIGGIVVHCHFFDRNTIAFDLDPREIDGPAQFTLVVQFMTDIGRLLHKEVRLTAENIPEAVIFRYDPLLNQVISVR